MVSSPEKISYGTFCNQERVLYLLWCCLGLVIKVGEEREKGLWF